MPQFFVEKKSLFKLSIALEKKSIIDVFLEFNEFFRTDNPQTACESLPIFYK